MAEPYWVLLVDDHPMVCRALRDCLERARGFQVVGQAERGRDIPRLLHRHAPDLIVLDLQMEEGFAPEKAIAQIRELVPGARIAVYTGHSEMSLVQRMAELRVDGYILKTERMDTVTQFLGDIARGTRRYSVGAVLALADAYHRESLDAIERTALQMLADGKTVPQIAMSMHIAERTARGYLQRAVRKLRSESRTGAVAEAMRQGQIL